MLLIRLDEVHACDTFMRRIDGWCNTSGCVRKRRIRVTRTRKIGHGQDKLEALLKSHETAKIRYSTVIHDVFATF